LNSLITFKAKDLVRFLEADLENFWVDEAKMVYSKLKLLYLQVSLK
jgi:hypothetical protein